MLPTRPAIRIDERMVGHDISYKLNRDDQTRSRWCSATWISTLMEKHAWLSAGFIWLPSASDPGAKGEYSDPKSEKPESRPTITLFELREEGSLQAKAVSARDYHFPMCFVVSCPWFSCPKALSLRDAVDGVAHNSREEARIEGVAHNSLSPGTHCPNQPSLSKGSTERNSLTFWWGATLCPPELNDVALAENVVIACMCSSLPRVEEA